MVNWKIFSISLKIVNLFNNLLINKIGHLLCEYDLFINKIGHLYIYVFFSPSLLVRWIILVVFFKWENYLNICFIFICWEKLHTIIFFFYINSEEMLKTYECTQNDMVIELESTSLDV